jgi:hypothetical protein
MTESTAPKLTDHFGRLFEHDAKSSDSYETAVAELESIIEQKRDQLNSLNNRFYMFDDHIPMYPFPLKLIRRLTTTQSTEITKLYREIHQLHDSIDEKISRKLK